MRPDGPQGSVRRVQSMLTQPENRRAANPRISLLDESSHCRSSIASSSGNSPASALTNDRKPAATVRSSVAPFPLACNITRSSARHCGGADSPQPQHRLSSACRPARHTPASTRTRPDVPRIHGSRVRVRGPLQPAKASSCRYPAHPRRPEPTARPPRSSRSHQPPGTPLGDSRFDQPTSCPLSAQGTHVPESVASCELAVKSSPHEPN